MLLATPLKHDKLRSGTGYDSSCEPDSLDRFLEASNEFLLHDRAAA